MLAYLLRQLLILLFQSINQLLIDLGQPLDPLVLFDLAILFFRVFFLLFFPVVILIVVSEITLHHLIKLLPFYYPSNQHHWEYRGNLFDFTKEDYFDFLPIKCER